MDKKYLYEFEIGSNRYQILKPTRQLREKSELYHLKQISLLISEGILPLAAYNSKVNGNSNLSTDDKRAALGKIIIGIQETSYDLNKLKAIDPEELTESNHKQMFELESKLGMLEQEFQNFQTIESQAFDHTAEGVAKNRLLTWLTAFLSYKNDEEIFKGATLDEKLDFAENIEDEELAAGITRLKVLVMAYSNGRAAKENDFAKIDLEIVDLLKKVSSSSEEESELQAAPPQDAAPDTSIIEQNPTANPVLTETSEIAASEEKS